MQFLGIATIRVLKRHLDAVIVLHQIGNCPTKLFAHTVKLAQIVAQMFFDEGLAEKNICRPSSCLWKLIHLDPHERGTPAVHEIQGIIACALRDNAVGEPNRLKNPHGFAIKMHAARNVIYGGLRVYDKRADIVLPKQICG